MITITEKQFIPFELGFTHGLVAHALEFDNVHNPYYKKYESDAYKAGYEFGRSDDMVSLWKKYESPRRALYISKDRLDMIGFTLSKDFEGRITIA